MQLIQYKKLFLSEARTKLKRFEDMILALEKDKTNAAVLEQLLLVLHSMKSDAATMSFLKSANAIHSVEDFFITVKNGDHKLTPSDLDNMFMVIDSFRKNLDTIEKESSEIDLGPVTAFIMRAASSAPKEAAPERAPVKSALGDQYEPLSSYVDIKTEELDQTLSKINDIVAANQQLQRLIQKGDVGGVRVGLYNLASKASDLRQSIVTMKLIPVKQYFVFLSRLVRDLARQQKKFITFDFKDNNLRFERSVLESIRDICVQLIKNAIDHGYREGEKGTISLEFEFKGGKIHVLVSDTGHGIDWHALVAAAEARSLMPPEAKKHSLSDELKRRLLFEFGISSRQSASLVSGRGLGLTIVRTTVESLHGTIEYASSARGRSRGTQFDITIPLTPTLFRALAWRWGSYYLAIPLFVVEKVIQLTDNAAFKGSKTYTYRGSKVRCVDVMTKLTGEHESSAMLSEARTLAIIKSESTGRIAVPLPAGVSEQELIIQPLVSLAKFKAIAGVAVSEESVPVIIINYRELF